ncbi:2-deoxystreptamine glucosyltransferase [Andreprevotia sp. IGB-42]|uniref:glycosyltransferase family 4 protein n=1 Tax=Andreprevotia sp. IGB-42 TaxID=2497473 RepID=UPI00135B5E2F|nr:glycosyltransferase family 4 protein [Andreprevotia sp. IGB-42]KAF0811500.1 2-deoxystreptamine glucosyltransferase [Andreprevotia sp. IGB-42]
MKILFLCKRRPQGRDLISRPYGRFYHLPKGLSERGHEVHMLLLSYKDDPAVSEFDGLIHWHSVSLRPRGPFAYLRKAKELLQAGQFDWIVGFSDTWYGILAQCLAKRFGIRSLIDAYDNYESYIPWAKPLHWAWRRACRRADALTAAGPGLLKRMLQDDPAQKGTVIPMAADPFFKPMQQAECRQQLGLPPDIALIGYCGSLFANRGVGILFEAIALFEKHGIEVKLVLTGRRQQNVNWPEALNGKIIELGYLPDAQMPTVLNAMNALLVINEASAFGNYSYPAKLYEAMQCGIPVVASAVEGTSWVLRDHPECLVTPRDATALAMATIATVRGSAKVAYSPTADWDQCADLLSQILEKTKP